CVPLRDRDALARVQVDVARWREALSNSWAKDVFVFCHEAEGSAANLRARMFAPGLGISEDPATGSAAAAFAGYLWKREGGPGQWIIAQGVEMGRPSTLHVQASGEGGQLRRVRVGGSAVRVSSGNLQLSA
ncbi:MAG TPA: PhzF family phenazine biosynthesis isomerase, partial [Chthoniobacterales bacterium]|nr:PhzF family phenazine biosynthesis isomerase [Chthoniobacterales bacterium]